MSSKSQKTVVSLSELVREIAKAEEVKPGLVDTVVRSLFDIIKREMRYNRRVVVHRFGSFEPVLTKRASYYDVQEKKRKETPIKVKPKVVFSNTFKDLLAGDRALKARILEEQERN